MKVILSVVEQTENARIDPRFGRCQYFALVDTDTLSTEFIKNDVQQSGSGINAATNVLRLQPDAIIVGSIGPKAFQVLERSGIDIYESSAATINEVIELFNNGKLKKIKSFNR